MGRVRPRVARCANHVQRDPSRGEHAAANRRSPAAAPCGTRFATTSTCSGSPSGTWRWSTNAASRSRPAPGTSRALPGSRPRWASILWRPVPCHNDLLAENYLDDRDRLWLVDWEYSGNNDPTFELGNTGPGTRLRRRRRRRAVRRLLRQGLACPARPDAPPDDHVRRRLDAVGRHPGADLDDRPRLHRLGGGTLGAGDRRARWPRLRRMARGRPTLLTIDSDGCPDCDHGLMSGGRPPSSDRSASSRSVACPSCDRQAGSMWQIKELSPDEVERVGAVLGLARLGQGNAGNAVRGRTMSRSATPIWCCPIRRTAGCLRAPGASPTRRRYGPGRSSRTSGSRARIRPTPALRQRRQRRGAGLVSTPRLRRRRDPAEASARQDPDPHRHARSRRRDPDPREVAPRAAARRRHGSAGMRPSASATPSAARPDLHERPSATCCCISKPSGSTARPVTSARTTLVARFWRGSTGRCRCRRILDGR